MSYRWIFVALLALAACKSPHQQSLTGTASTRAGGGVITVGPVSPTLADVMSLQNSFKKDEDVKCAEDALQTKLRNDTSAQAFKNVLGATKGATAVIAGHGNIGHICTGASKNDNCYSSIGDWNESEWGQPADNLQKRELGTLLLLGCNVASGDRGRDLITAVAKRAQCTVVAPTGLVNCENGVLTLDDSTHWRKATRDGTTSPDTTPTIEFQSPQTIEFELDGIRERVPWLQSLVRVEEIQSQKAFDQPYMETIPDEIAQPLAHMIDFSHPFEMRGRPLAVTTGTIALRIGLPRFAIRKTFVIYSDQVAQDLDHPSWFYHVSSTFAITVRRRRALNTPSPR